MAVPNSIVVFDLETDGVDTDKCEVVQVACLAINSRTLRTIPGSEFFSYLKPLNMDTVRAQGLAISGTTKEQLQNAPDRESVWKRFAEHVRKYNYGKTKTSTRSAPIAAGKNIIGFDMHIVERLCAQYGMTDKNGEQNLFNQYYRLDLEHDLYRWFGHCDELPNMKMDTIRKYMGMSTENAHHAMKDVKQESALVIKYLELYRNLFGRISFKDCFAGTGV